MLATLFRGLHTPFFRGLRTYRRVLTVLLGLCLLPAWVIAQQQFQRPHSIVQKIDSATERMEMIVKSSRILTLEQNIPRAQVNNPEVLELTALSPNQIQVLAKRPGVTQVNLWNEQGEIFTIDVAVYGDSRELQMLLKREFPNTSIRITPVGNSVVLSGYVAEAGQVSRIVRMSELYYPSVINNMQVGGVQQVVLNVKIMEVSRTKLRKLGIDFAALSGGGDVIATSISGLLSAADVGNVTGDTLRFTGSSFFAFLDALRQNDLLKVLAEPRIMAISGRPASFHVGGEFPVLVSGGALAAPTILWKNFGTQVDFVPIVLGNGNIKLEVRASISERDNSQGVTTPDGITTPGLTVREVNTGVEMKPGQTLALAGLIQVRTEAQNAGIPWLSDLPWIGAGFRRVREVRNEIELLILIRPELVEPLDPHEVPPGGPGLNTTSPDDVDLYWRGHLEVPYCPPGPFPGRLRGALDKPPAPALQQPGTPAENPAALPAEEARTRPRGAVIRPAASPGAQLLAPRIEQPPLRSGRWSDRFRTRRSAAPTVLRGALQQPRMQSQLVIRPDTYHRTPGADSPWPNSTSADGSPGLIGPIGYDILK